MFGMATGKLLTDLHVSFEFPSSVDSHSSEESRKGQLCDIDLTQFRPYGTDYYGGGFWTARNPSSGKNKN